MAKTDSPIITATVKVADLVINDRNPRYITEDAFGKLKQSVDEFRVMQNWQPIVVDADNVVYSGNQRLRALREIGQEEVAVIVMDPETSEEDKREFLVKANVSAGLFDTDILSQDYEAEELGEWGLDLVFSEEENHAGEDIYDVDEEVETKFKFGTVAQIGPHRVVCGDATEKASYEKLMQGRIADMVHCDPPYNVAYGESKNPRHKIRSIENDKLNDADWETFCRSFMRHLDAWSEGDVYMWGGSGPEGMKMRLWICEEGCHWSATIIWKKDQLVLSPAKYQRIYEPCFYGWFNKSSFRADRKQTEHWEFARPKRSKEHPTMKPIELCAEAIKNSSEKQALVLDPFLGSGSTMVAAHEMERVCYGLELSPQYCQVIVNRMLALDPTLKVTYSDE